MGNMGATVSQGVNCDTNSTPEQHGGNFSSGLSSVTWSTRILSKNETLHVLDLGRALLLDLSRMWLEVNSSVLKAVMPADNQYCIYRSIA